MPLLKKKVIAIIPCRSGSKKIKNKNLIKIQNRYLIGYSVLFAKECGFFDKIIVSTDSIKYKKIAVKYGADVPFLRSKKLSGDKVKDYPVIKNCLKISEKYYKTLFDYIVLLRPTSPFREKLLIEKGLKIKFKNNQWSARLK